MYLCLLACAGLLLYVCVCGYVYIQTLCKCYVFICLYVYIGCACECISCDYLNDIVF